MPKLPELLIFTDDQKFMSLFSTEDFLQECNLHITNKNQLGLTKIKSGKFDAIVYHIQSNEPSEIKFFDNIFEANNKIPKIIVSAYYKETWHKIFGSRISKFIPLPSNNNEICNTILSLLHGNEKDSKSHFSGVLDKNKLLMLFELSRKFNSIHDTNELFYSFSTNATKVFESERATVFVLNREKTELISRVAIGLDNSIIRVPVSKGVIGHVILTGKTYITNDPENSPYFDSEIDKKNQFKTRNIICVPLKNIEGEVIGVFELINKINGDFGKEDQFYLETIASMVSMTLENTLLRHFLKRRIHEYNLLKNKFDELSEKSSEEKQNPELEELFNQIENIKQTEDIVNNFISLRKMLKGNKTGTELLENIENALNKMSGILNSIAAKRE